MEGPRHLRSVHDDFRYPNPGPGELVKSAFDRAMGMTFTGNPGARTARTVAVALPSLLRSGGAYAALREDVDQGGEYAGA